MEEAFNSFFDVSEKINRTRKGRWRRSYRVTDCRVLHGCEFWIERVFRSWYTVYCSKAYMWELRQYLEELWVRWIQIWALLAVLEGNTCLAMLYLKLDPCSRASTIIPISLLPLKLPWLQSCFLYSAGGPSTLTYLAHLSLGNETRQMSSFLWLCLTDLKSFRN